MLDSETKRRIDTARDILVGKIPDPKSQIEQITIALIYKFMDDMDKKSEELGGKAKFFTGDYSKYAWNKLMDASLSGFELVNVYGEAIQSMNQNPNAPQLFRDIFKNAYLPYRDPSTLKSFLKIIDDFTYDHSERLGDAFEYLLSVMGSQGDAGQFRTPRHIIEFIVDVVDPSINDTILDPACGTAGFLISAYKHILEKHLHEGKNTLTPDERKKLVENIVGYDISPDMVRLSLVNLYLHGFKNPAIYEYDTLTSDEKWDETFDVCLANPPFMTPKGGIRPHKRFSVSSNRAEVLFVDYMHEHLNNDGRAGIVVPEGIIFQSGSTYKDLRKNLLNDSLYAVVSLPAGVFNPYSGVKTSILFLDKKIAKKSKEVLFVKVEADGYNLGAQRREIKENDLPLALEVLKEFQNSVLEGIEPKLEKFEKTIAHIVHKDKIADQDYNLSGDRYKEVAVYDGNWDLVELEELLDYEQPTKYIVESVDYEDSFKTPVLTAGKSFILGYTNEKEGIYTNLPCIIFDDFTTDFKWVDFKFKVKSSAMKILTVKNEKVNLKFVYYMMQGIDFDASTHKRYYLSQYAKQKIPLPPLEVQERIVEEIESYQNIIDGAKKVVESYKPSFKIDPEWDVVELGDIVKLSSGKFLPKTKQKNGEFSVYGGNGIFGTHDEFFIEEPTVIIGRVGAYCGVVHITKPKSWITDNALYVSELLKDIDLAFLYFNLERIDLHKYAKVGGQPSISQSSILDLKIPFPPIKTQKEIVAQIEEEQKLVDSNKQLIEIFEKKVKDKISEVWGE